MFISLDALKLEFICESCGLYFTELLNKRMTSIQQSLFYLPSLLWISLKDWPVVRLFYCLSLYYILL